MAAFCAFLLGLEYFLTQQVVAVISLVIIRLTLFRDAFFYVEKVVSLKFHLVWVRSFNLLFFSGN